MIESLSAIAGILLVDLALSGDNALVIGASAAKLPRRQRWLAILFGGIGAALLRIIFAFIASSLLVLPWLQALGGLILLIIAIRLLAGRNAGPATTFERQASPQPAETSGAAPGFSRAFLAALLTILVADATMSLDNVLAVGALSQGNLLVLSVGILVSIAILLAGSALVAEMMKWLPWLLDIAALVLGWTGANMMLNDLRLGDILAAYAWTDIVLPIAALGIILCADIFLRLRAQKLARVS